MAKNNSIMEEIDYLGSGVSFFFESSRGIYHIIINGSGHVGIYLNDDEHWNFTEWLAFKDQFPEIEKIVTDVTVKKLNMAMKGIQAVEYKAAIDEVNNNMYC